MRMVRTCTIRLVGGSVSVFFQAEDGIRDLVRSRGLGDVYKRQRSARRRPTCGPATSSTRPARTPARARAAAARSTSVSYTHLTLPTSDIV